MKLPMKVQFGKTIYIVHSVKWVQKHNHSVIFFEDDGKPQSTIGFDVDTHAISDALKDYFFETKRVNHAVG